MNTYLTRVPYYRHYHPWHHNLSIATNEHGAAHCQDDAKRPRSHLARHHQSARLDDPILHPAGLAAPRHVTD